MKIKDGQPCASSVIGSGSDPLRDLLFRRARGESAAKALLGELTMQLGLPVGTESRVLMAMALISTGSTLESVASLLTWAEFETFCAQFLRAHGFVVRTNIVMTKPRRQIDIFATSHDLALSVDCKHWEKGFSASELERIVTGQIERTRVYKRKQDPGVPILPTILTMVPSPAKQVLGVPVVPVFMLPDFLTSINRFVPGIELL